MSEGAQVALRRDFIPSLAPAAPDTDDRGSRGAIEREEQWQTNGLLRA
jgi:hypothetical protein